MRRFLVLVAVLIYLFLPTQAFSQSSNATVSGTIVDASGSVLPGVRVTATNINTGVVTTETSNTAGIYRFLSLQPGEYKLSAEMAGFQTYTYTGLQLGVAAQVRQNFTLQLRKLEQSVEVTSATDRLILESSSSTGSVLPEREVAALPIVSNNALDLVKIMGGAVIGNNPVWDADNTAFAGVRAANINVQRDGVTINDVRNPTGINSPTRLNPEMIGEFRMLLSPIDAEVGRGNGQVQVLTRTGANAFHGSAIWNIRNSALDANTWYNNTYHHTAPYSNQNEYTLDASGPIIKNKTFFFVLWNHQLTLQRVGINPIVLTPCAQKGIFRYYDNWNNGNVTQNTIRGGSPTIAVVDRSGNPVEPTTNPDNTLFTGQLRYASVFAPLANIPTRSDCSDAVFQTGAATWDSQRTQRDPTGFIDSKFLALMPLPPNNYEVGDGLNTAGYRWDRRLHGGANLWGIGEDNERRQINVRIDHNITTGHRLSGSYSYDSQWADDSYTNWPKGYGGTNQLRPQVLTISLISTLRPTLLNEARFGMSRTGTNVFRPIDTPGSSKPLKALLPTANGETIIVGPGSAGSNFSVQMGNNSHFYGTSGLLPVGDRDTSPRYSVGDTISWMKGKHAFKAGFEVRLSSTNERATGNWFAGNTDTPFAMGGSASGATMMFNANPTAMAGVSGQSGNRNNFEGLLNLLSGSIGTMQQYYFVNSPTQTAWNDPLKDYTKIRDVHEREFDVFLKDDWKVSDSLTLNLGVRYEYYGVPYLSSGLTPALKGGATSLFGPGLGFQNWMPANPVDTGFRTEQIFVGPGSQNSGLQPFSGDFNNIGPAVGFAWNPPWFGKGKTTIRGGYQLNYLPYGRLGDWATILGSPPGTTYTSNWTGDASHPYFDLTMLSAATPVPIPSGVLPLTTMPVTDRTATIYAVDPNLASPYIQNVTLAVTRNVTSNLTVDVRYIGTMSRKMTGNLNINSPNFMSNGLRDAFNAARRGDESALLDRMFSGVRGSVSGAQFLRTAFIWAPSLYLFTPASTYLAMGDYQNLANELNAANSWNFFNSCGGNGCFLRTGGLPENFIKTNPQFNTANWYSNLGSMNYNGLQAQVTLRPTHGVSFQATYTWSKNLGYDVNAPLAFSDASATGFTDPRDRRADYALLSMHRAHTLTTYGTFELPFGPNRLLFNSKSGVISRIAGGWQLSWTGNVATGMPSSINAQNMLYGRGVADRVGPFDPKSAAASWADGALAGNYYGNRYKKVRDPQCTNSSIVAPSLQASCTLTAVADASSGQVVLQNPMPGMRGNLGLDNFFRPGTWNVDMAVSKAVKITEGKSLAFRMDVSNVFNHVIMSGWGDIQTRRTTQRVDTAGPPDVNINSTAPFGDLPAKVGTRMFQAKVRFDF